MDCGKTGRGERIRTSGLYVPNHYLQAQESYLGLMDSIKINNLAYHFRPFPSLSTPFKVASVAQNWYRNFRAG
ncbi:hypothetical protein FHT26_001848 [Rhizobacter sp. SG703]|nr:hypothetical protein [Rhizobacter sp. SG703]